MEHAARGAAALSASDGPAAIAAYTKALIERPTAPDYWTQRSIAFTRLKAPLGPRNDLAFKDAEYGVLCAQKRAKRDKIQAAQQRRVVALFGLGRYGDSAFILQKMVRWRTSEKKDKMEGDIWKAKIEQKLKVATGKQATDVTAKEYPDFELPDEKELKKELASQLKADGTFRFEDMVGNISISSNGGTRESASRTDHGQLPVTGKLINGKSDVSQTGPAPAANSIAMKPLSKVRHEWYQNAQSITVTIYAKGVKKAEADIDIQDDSVRRFFTVPRDIC
jgi:suppressor of G2 allele of SKP1